MAPGGDCGNGGGTAFATGPNTGPTTFACNGENGIVHWDLEVGGDVTLTNPTANSSGAIPMVSIDYLPGRTYLVRGRVDVGTSITNPCQPMTQACLSKGYAVGCRILATDQHGAQTSLDDREVSQQGTGYTATDNVIVLHATVSQSPAAIYKLKIECFIDSNDAGTGGQTFTLSRPTLSVVEVAQLQ
jgi:hypothetical protein